MAKIIFFGTPEFVIPILEALHKNFEVVAVVTQPPKPSGREKFLTYSPVDNWAHKRKMKLIKDVSEVPQADLGVCAAYGKIIPESVIKKFEFGILNIHPSLLPKYRGASPVQSAITAGDTETGLTIIKMDAEMDHGDIISSFREKVLDTDTTETLTKRLFERASQFLVDLIPNYLNGKITSKPQDHSKATPTKIIKKEDAYLNLDSKSPEESERFIRAMYPWPIAWTLLRLSASEGQAAKRLKIIKAHLENKKLILDEVQLEGKSPVAWKQLLEGYPNLKF